MVSIIRKISPYNHYENANDPKYIVEHYTGNKGDTAKNNADYFFGGNRNASAHYFVDDKEIYQVVEDLDGAFAVGDGDGAYGITNRNSINIEMCCNSNGIISEKTESNTIELTKSLMKKYNIPASNVVRHYDASRKICPNWSADNWTRWNKFKSKLTSNTPSNEPTLPLNKPLIDEWVKRLQIVCNAQNFSNQVVDGIPGPNTLKGCPTLKQKAKGDITKLMQERLTKLNYDTNGVEGVFGTGTLTAVKNYQKDKGLKVDGIVGENTWKCLLGL